MPKTETITFWSAIAFVGWCAFNTLILSDVPCATRILTGGCCIGASLVVSSLLGWSPELVRKYALPIVLVCAGVFECFYGLFQLMGWYPSNNSHYAVTGSFFNPGPYGGFMAVCAASSLGLSETFMGKRWRGWFLCIAIALCYMVVISISRGAILALALVAAIIWRRLLKRHLLWVTIVAVAMAVCLYFLKSGSAHGRIVMAFMSIKAWGSAFLLGHGAGSYLYALSLTEIAYNGAHQGSWVSQSVGVAEYPFCEPLKIAVEYGLVGLLLFSSTIVFALRSLWQQKSPSFYALLSMVCFSFSSYPFSLWPFTLVFWLLVGQASLPQQKRLVELTQMSYRVHANKEVSSSSKAQATVRLFALLVGGIILVTFVPSLNERREAEKTFSKFSFIKSEALIKDYYELLPNMNDNRRFLFTFGQILRDAGRFNDSNDMLRRCAQVSNDPMVLVLMGRNYESLCAVELAERAYIDAFNMMPNRLYPLYRLMKMHSAQGNKAESFEYARRVINFEARIPSQAINEMKSEAKDLLSNENELF